MATEKYILVESDNGLHCLSLNTGNRLWQFGPTYGGTNITDGCTPAVDQTNGWVYYQSLGRLWKLDVYTGAMLDYVQVSTQTRTISGSTILVNDTHGYFIITLYFAIQAYGGAIKVYDQNLNLVWQVIGLNLFIKDTLAYYDGVVYCGTGDLFQYDQNHGWYDGQLEDCRVIAYNVTNGNVLWTFNPDPTAMYVPNGNKAIGQVNYCNGYIIAFSDIGGGEGRTNGILYVLNASNGNLVKSFTHSTRVGACGRSAFSYGRFFKGNLTTMGTEVFQIGVGSKTDFAPFGTAQTNNGVAPAGALASLDENITYLGKVTGTTCAGAQGGIIYNGKAYFCGTGSVGGVLCFDIETLSVIKEYDAGPIWDSSPMIVKNSNDEEVLLVYREEGKKVAAFDVASGDLLWETGDDIDGYLFFGFNFFESSIRPIENDLSSSSFIDSINTNFNYLNSLISNQATLTTITSSMSTATFLSAINTNIDAINSFIGNPIEWQQVNIGDKASIFKDRFNNYVLQTKNAI